MSDSGLNNRHVGRVSLAGRGVENQDYYYFQWRSRLTVGQVKTER